MAAGQTGRHGVLVVWLVEREVKLKQEIVQIQHQPMVAKIVVQQTLAQLHRPAIIYPVQ